MLFLDLLQRGEANSHDDGYRQPCQDNGHRQSMDRARHERPAIGQLMVAHSSFNLQDANALASCVIFCALTTPSTKMRQPRLSLVPCAATPARAVASVLANSTDHGRGASSTRRGSASTASNLMLAQG